MTEKNGADLIAAERRRQIEQEGWTPEHDDAEHGFDELARAAAWYALPARLRAMLAAHGVDVWPWGEDWRKPGDGSLEGRIRELEKSGALIAAEIDRLLRRAGQGFGA